MIEAPSTSPGYLQRTHALVPAPRITQQEEFGRILSRARADAPPTDAEIRAHAEEFVASALVQPILKALRESNQAAEPFKPSSGEKSFRGLLDTAWSTELVRSGNWKLVDRIAEQFKKRAGGTQ